MEVSVVIVTYHSGGVLFRCIEALLRQENLKEVILIDNGNTKQALDELGRISADNVKLRIISGHGNIGFSAGCNLGAAKALSPYLLFLNPDAIVESENFLSQLVLYYQQYPQAILAGVKVLNVDASIQKTTVRNILTPKIAILSGLGIKANCPINIDVENVDQTTIVPAITGACMFISSDNFKKLAGFDEGYFLHAEDMDLCIRANKIGKIIYIPHLKVTHYLSTSKVSSVFVEKQKIKSFTRYFALHFNKAKNYFLPLIYARFVLMMLIKLFTVKEKHQQGGAVQEFLRTPDQALAHQNIKENILLAGSTNQIALCLIRRLVANDIKFSASYHLHPISFYDKRINWLKLDLSNIKAIPDNIDTIIYTAPLWFLPNLLRTNTQIKRVICFSTTSIFTKADSNNNEEKKLIAKIIAAQGAIEEICKVQNINYTILRPTMIYGLGIDTNISFIYKMIKKFGFFPIYQNAKGLRQPVHADDLAKAALQIIANANTFNKSYNLSGSLSLSYYDMLKHIFSILKKKVRIIKISFFPLLLDIYGRVFCSKINASFAKRMEIDMVFDSTQAAKDFGYEPRAFLTSSLHDFTY
jgi:GT2 family glycosyltransferase